MDLQVDKNQHLRHLILFEFNRGSNGADAARNICAVYGENFTNKMTVNRWYARFREGNFELSDAPRSGRPVEFDEERLVALLQENNRQTTRELAEQMGCDQSTIVRHLQSMGKVQKLGSWVPHELNQNNKNQRVTACASLLARHRQAAAEHRPFLSLIVTGDEKWCLYVNMKQRKEWVDKEQQANPRVKQDLHPRKTMLCVWWGKEGIIYWELLPRNQTITAEVYSQQLRRLAEKIRQKRSNRRYQMILQHDNARPHVANLTKMVIQELGWEVLQHPPNSPDLAPSDYYLFRALQNALRGVTFNNDEELQNWLENWFASKDAAFYRRGIEKLPERWEEVVNNGGEYVID
jgi:histone-lysine N-methyltransferase SETMAR